MPHSLYVGTLTDLWGFFFPVRGLRREDFSCSLFDDCLHGWLLSWLFIIFGCSSDSPPCAFPPCSLWNRRLKAYRAHRCLILRVTSISRQALLLFIRVRLTGPRLWQPRGMKTWRDRPLAQPSALTLDRLLSPPRPVQASPAHCHTPRIQPRDSHLTW